MTLVRSWICRHENIKVILDVQLWELVTQRLHQGLSETILVNTLTDVRELTKSVVVKKVILPLMRNNCLNFGAMHHLSQINKVFIFTYTSVLSTFILYIYISLNIFPDRRNNDVINMSKIISFVVK